MLKLLSGDKAKLGLASTAIQAANLLLLLVAKATVSDEDFAFMLTNLAIAGIVGSVASMRLEVLVFQEHARMTFAALLMPLAAVGVVTMLSLIGLEVTSSQWAGTLDLSALAVPMIVGLGLSATLSFLFVQLKQVGRLLLLRITQSAGLVVIMIGLLLNEAALGGRALLTLIGLAYAAPAIFGAIRCFRSLDRIADGPAMHRPDIEMAKRAGLLTVSTGVNSVYVNMPLLAAAASQTAGFVADFGLIMRCFTAPITLIFQVMGRLFLADAIDWSATAGRTRATLRRLILRTMTQSVGVYLLGAPVLFGVLYLFRGPFGFDHLSIAPFLFLATVGQCAINPVSQVRIALRDEQTFLLFDMIRLVGLAFGLYIVARIIPFEMAFGITALTLYTTYAAFIMLRVARRGPQQSEAQ